MTDLPIRKVLQKPDVAGRMVRWVVELSEFDIQYEPRGPIKGQVYTDFVVELSPDKCTTRGGGQLQMGALSGWVIQPAKQRSRRDLGRAERSLLAKSDSLLVTGLVTGEYQAKDPQMATYLGYVQLLKGSFVVFELVHVLREQNARADLLAKLAVRVSTARGRVRSHKSVTQETLRTPSVSAYPVVEGEPMQICIVEEGDTWMTPYRRYLADGILSLESAEAKKIKRNSSKYTLVDGDLFRHGFTHPILMKYLVVAIEYFTKWIEAELVAQMIAHKIQHFVWKNIVCCFGVPRRLVSDNGTQFASQQLGKLCAEVGIKQVFTSVEDPQTNGQVESANRVLLRGLKRRLEKAKGTWAEEVPRIVWAYHTTPQSVTRETPFSLVYGSDAMILVEIQECSPRFQSFVAKESNKERKVNLDLLDEKG
ncbi:uncharacterized protein [Phaseolus vulgaris]|uniref:uncharacterized protein n=1 Tax=Phaseolus vulgaris TaxID=3885 RepID=UPI0035CA88D7